MRKPGLVLTALVLLLTAMAAHRSAAAVAWKNEEAKETKVWKSEIPESCPLPRSAQFAALGFTGRYANYTRADTWYPSWGADDRMYSPFTDGGLKYTAPDGTVKHARAGSGGRNVSTVGYAVIAGDDPFNLQIVHAGNIRHQTSPYGGRYPSASLYHNGVWYLGSYGLAGAPYKANWPICGPFAGFHISTDNGKTWTISPRNCEVGNALFPEPEKLQGPVRFGAPHVVDFGKNMENSPDGKMYMVGHGSTEPDQEDRQANASWITGDQIYLCRVVPSPETINEGKYYEYFGGHDADGNPVWTKNFEQVKPIVDWDNHTGCVTVTYNKPLDRYLMCVTDGRDTLGRYDTYLLEAERITGPWKMATYMRDFGTQAYFVNIPGKFIGADGRTFWLCYSGNWTRSRPVNPPGGLYAMSLHEVRLLNAEEAADLAVMPPAPTPK